ncbi:replication-associated recombination protein A [Endozoicomonas sp. SM1973]|uniref:Replication-associated recombination protein A n=1 Tax=Spartinivicinus marinus TaxID=2994442 RepID=A0A853I5J9_9GAMM|nr:replication-associated recombination protein A [Spartinivicinus marinus]MCX4029002.1 replication-associated recombination protein A [Spartinivicinus marinus]NYZ65414.1 replication-associated recombination protein A [Spartinivicinus marinus]
MSDLFADQSLPWQPLAARMRPRILDEYVGQAHLLGPGEPLGEAIRQGQLHSMVLWGPPGVGKTTLAKLVAEYTKAHFQTLSAVLAGVKDIREAVQQAKMRQQPTILFVDEVHRFNKAQQDAFLPYVEDGTIVFVGATTENPAFELNNALLSRARVYTLKPLEDEQLEQLLMQALTDRERGIGKKQLSICSEAQALLLMAANGDARRLLNVLEVVADLAVNDTVLTVEQIKPVIADLPKRFDKGGDVFYDQISALHKAVRGSSPDAALYWYARMLDGGCDPLYIARRVVRMASEDIGNADPRALSVCLSAWDVQERLGSPEGELAIAQAITYCACAPKSNAAYVAYKKACAAVKELPDYEVPIHLRNAPTKLQKSLGHGAEYRYAHDEPNAYVAGEQYFPPEMVGTQFYHPVDRGLEQKIKQKLMQLAEWDQLSEQQRYSD